MKAIPTPHAKAPFAAAHDRRTFFEKWIECPKRERVFKLDGLLGAPSFDESNKTFRIRPKLCFKAFFTNQVMKEDWEIPEAPPAHGAAQPATVKCRVSGDGIGWHCHSETTYTLSENTEASVPGRNSTAIRVRWVLLDSSMNVRSRWVKTIEDEFALWYSMILEHLQSRPIEAVPAESETGKQASTDPLVPQPSSAGAGANATNNTSAMTPSQNQSTVLARKETACAQPDEMHDWVVVTAQDHRDQDEEMHPRVSRHPSHWTASAVRLSEH